MKAHPICWQGDHYEHVCQEPTGKPCIDCGEPAGTRWGKHWCPDCDVKRINRISRQLDELAAAMKGGDS